MGISVIVCLYKLENSQIGDLLVSFYNQKFEHTSETFEIVLVDNNINFDLKELLRKYVPPPNIKIKVAKQTLQGLSNARNKGIEAADGDILVFIDDDVIVSKTLVQNYLIFYRRYSKAVCAGGEMRFDFNYFNGKIEIPNQLLLKYIGGNNLSLKKVTKIRKYRHTGGANISFKREVFENYGYFEDEFGRKGDKLLAEEETSIVAKLAKHGNRCYYIPDTYILHRPYWAVWTFEKLLERAKYAGKSEKRIYNKYLNFHEKVILKIKIMLTYILIKLKLYFVKDESLKRLLTYEVVRQQNILF